MSKKLYVGSLPYSIDDVQLEGLAKPFGAIISAKVIQDKFSGRSKGFGFVEFENADDADRAIAGLNGKEIEGRTLTVNEAKPMAPRTGGGRDRDRDNRGGGYGSRW